MKKLSVAFVTIFIVLFVFSISFQIFSYTLEETMVVTIEDKERINQEDESYYLVFATDENGKPIVFKNVDSLLFGKWDSSNVQAGLKIGKTYEVTLRGMRIPFFSMYQNIINYKEV